ncbi:MAG TPA: hypothetical protein VHT04_15100 [Stellaceae bacterium]|jgi:hypothetical protein|nr:hypothetical protein [Stellaceae bacterium]
MLMLVDDDWRRGEVAAAGSSDEDRHLEEAIAEDATALAFAGLSLREAATRTLGC